MSCKLMHTDTAHEQETNRVCMMFLTLQLAHRDCTSEYNPANFGDSRRGRLCMCEVPGQVPCPSRVPIPPELKQHKWHDKCRV